MPKNHKYIIISPVKDEERYVELTLKSVVNQTLKPLTWIIVDDGSSDKTAEIIQNYTLTYSFIKLVGNPHAGIRKTGSAVIRAFNHGYESIDKTTYDFIVKLDCDLSFQPDYFEKLLEKFTADEQLGIASGVYLEKKMSGKWLEIKMPSYHAAGASKVIRRRCFEEIGGFIAMAGWDTVDEIRAMAKGWRTRHFPELRIRHHKPEGSGIGQLRTSMMHGKIFYITGGSKIFFIIKTIHRLSARPYVLNSMALLWGYLNALFKRRAMLVTKYEAKCYQAMLIARLRAQIKKMFT